MGLFLTWLYKIKHAATFDLQSSTTPLRRKILNLTIISKLWGTHPGERKKTEKRKSSSDTCHSESLNYENPACKNIIIVSTEDVEFPPVLEKAPILVLICCYQSFWKKRCHTFSNSQRWNSVIQMQISGRKKKVLDCQRYKDFIPSAFVS